jgi:beta-glucosidase
VQVSVINESTVDADEVVQFFVGAPGIAAVRWAKQLKGFKRVTVNAGATETVTGEIALASLQWRDPVTHQWLLEPGEYRIMAGSSSDRLIATTVML